MNQHQNCVNACIYFMYYRLNLLYSKHQVGQYHYLPLRQTANMYLQSKYQAAWTDMQKLSW